MRHRFSRHPVVAGLAAGFLLWTSFPPAEWSWLAWIALTPLFWLVTLREARFKAYLAAWVGGFVFWLLALEWLRMLDANAWLGWFVMALVFSLWWPAFLALTRWAVFRLQVPLLLAAPITWVGLEYARAYFLTGFPWYYLAHSQFRHLYLIQIADFSSSLGISFLIAIVNAMLVDLLTLPLFRRSKQGRRLMGRQNVRLCLVTILLGTTLCYGAFRVSTAQFHDGPKLALLQSNIEQRHKLKGDPLKIIAELAGLIERSLARTGLPDLIVWPETSYPYGFIAVDPAIESSALERQVRSITEKLSVGEWLERRNVIAGDLHFRTDEARVPMLVGSIYYDHQPRAVEKYNSAILFKPGLRTIHFYHKMHLVPFGEYFPLIETLPWLAALTPYHGEKVQSLSFGREPLTLPLGPYRLAVSICFEDTIPQVINRFFRAAADGHQPDILINLSNDGWYHGSAELDIHLAIGVFRAVEHRVPLARAVNTGLTALVDGNGEIREALPKETQGVLSVTVPLDDRTSCYSRWGDWLGLSCLAVSIGLIPIGWVRKPRGPSQDN
ncbi:MAG: apolipoprotein N-acyltransferase [Isosphaerales bacterium]